MAKELVILIGRDAGASVQEVAGVTRRCDTARQRVGSDSKPQYAEDPIEHQYSKNIEESKA